MRPAEVLDAQRDLIERAEGQPRFRRMLDYFVRFHAAPDTDPLGGGPVEPGIAALTDVLVGHVRTAYAYRVSHDMSVMVQHAAAMLEPEDRFDPEMAPTGCGIVRLDRPLPVQDIRGDRMLIHWIVWGPMLGGTGMAFMNDLWTEPDSAGSALFDSMDEQMQHIVGRWGTIGLLIRTTGDPLGEQMVDSANSEQVALLDLDGLTPQPSTNLSRYVMALWMLMDQTVTRVEVEEPDRAGRKRAERAKLPPQVTVIRLRRESNAVGREPGESQVEWTHRWVVRGHWRWQRHGVGRTERKRIWIAPFVKGPEDAPFVQSDKVYSLER